MRQGAGHAAAAFRTPAPAEWEAALETALPPWRLAAWFDALGGVASAERLGRAIDAAAALVRPGLHLPARARLALVRQGLHVEARTALCVEAARPAGPPPAVAGADLLDAASGAFPAPWPAADLLAVASLMDTVLSPGTLAALAVAWDRLAQPQRVKAVAAALDRALPRLPTDSATTDAVPHAEQRPHQSTSNTGGQPLAERLVWAAVRGGMAARSVHAVAAALLEPHGADAAARLVDAAAAPARAWAARVAAVPAAVQLSWSFHFHLAFPRHR
jgi:hypothetical protein